MCGKKITWSPRAAPIPSILWQTAGLFVTPTIVVCAAHASDLLYARFDEIRPGGGVDVLDEFGDPILDSDGKKMVSTIGGWWALGYTFIQRSITVASTLFIASAGRSTLSQLQCLPRSKLALSAMEIGFVAVGLGLSVPFSLGLLPTYLQFRSVQLEEKFHKLLDVSGQPRKLYVYRGD